MNESHAAASDMHGKLVLTVIASSMAIMGCGEKAGPVRHSEKEGPRNCCVTIYGPGYDPGEARPSIDLYWDGRRLYSDVLPLGGDLTGMPTKLVIIDTNPGTHVLKVDSGSASQQYGIELKDAEHRAFMIFGSKDGKEVLIEDMGADPMFL